MSVNIMSSLGTPGALRGLVAEWLRRGLQILAPRFDSGRGLQMLAGSSAIAPERGSSRSFGRVPGAGSGLLGHER
ncbi:hypothetical protein MPLDJ20_120379 [Mesorhizobium plurifarium]|uniref:Uncharacterized protein n=1 Tax=Mesorhizobium plurifarium TaxID=69974 RepID=A0A090GD48_MESPL|nr:hypothetical protein MPLDJ20_120379 [Mesorhizobium plurifarium]CDX58709.1 hypothetical protein MPL3365_30267 [Mesorhizobium plurifarium]